MKKNIVLFILLSFLNLCTYAQGNKDKEFCISELKNFLNNRLDLFSYLDEKEQNVYIIDSDKNIIKITQRKKEDEESANHELIINLIIQENKSENSVNIKKNVETVVAIIDRYNFSLRIFIKKALENILKDNRIISEDNDSHKKIISTTDSQDSECVTQIYKNEDNIIIAVYYSINL